MLALLLGWVLPCQSTPSLLHKRPKGRFGLLSIVYSACGGTARKVAHSRVMMAVPRLERGGAHSTTSLLRAIIVLFGLCFHRDNANRANMCWGAIDLLGKQEPSAFLFDSTDWITFE